MPTNPYFRQFRVRNERDLIDDLLQETIQIHGIDVLYLPRSAQNFDLIYGEDTLSKFDDYYDIEIYVDSQSFEGGQELMSKFGLEIDDQVKISMSKTRFDQATNYEMERPREGDLIYDPVTESLFEIKFVNDDERWFQLGDLPVYKLDLAKFVYGQEKIDTGIEEIDQIEHDFAQKLVLELDDPSGDFLEGEWIFQGPSLNSATAKAEVVCWDYTTNKLEVINVFDRFEIAKGAITGASSGSDADLISEPNLLVIDQKNTQSDNYDLEVEAQGYLDFSEDDIFGFLKDN